MFIKDIFIRHLGFQGFVICMIQGLFLRLCKLLLEQDQNIAQSSLPPYLQSSCYCIQVWINFPLEGDCSQQLILNLQAQIWLCVCEQAVIMHSRLLSEMNVSFLSVSHCWGIRHSFCSALIQLLNTCRHAITVFVPSPLEMVLQENVICCPAIRSHITHLPSPELKNNNQRSNSMQECFGAH